MASAASRCVRSAGGGVLHAASQRAHGAIAHRSSLGTAAHQSGQLEEESGSVGTAVVGVAPLLDVRQPAIRKSSTQSSCSADPQAPPGSRNIATSGAQASAPAPCSIMQQSSSPAGKRHSAGIAQGFSLKQVSVSAASNSGHAEAQSPIKSGATVVATGTDVGSPTSSGAAEVNSEFAGVAVPGGTVVMTASGAAVVATSSCSHVASHGAHISTAHLLCVGIASHHLGHFDVGFGVGISVGAKVGAGVGVGLGLRVSSSGAAVVCASQAASQGAHFSTAQRLPVGIASHQLGQLARGAAVDTVGKEVVCVAVVAGP